MSGAEVTWTDDAGTTHALHPGMVSGLCHVVVTIKVYDCRPVTCMACIGYEPPAYRPTIPSPMNRPNLQQIPKSKT